MRLDQADHPRDDDPARNSDAADQRTTGNRGRAGQIAERRGLIMSIRSDEADVASLPFSNDHDFLSRWS